MSLKWQVFRDILRHMHYVQLCGCTGGVLGVVLYT